MANILHMAMALKPGIISCGQAKVNDQLLDGKKTSVAFKVDMA